MVPFRNNEGGNEKIATSQEAEAELSKRMLAIVRNCKNQCSDVKGEAQAAKTARREYRSGALGRTTLKQKAYHEFKEMLIISLFLWVVFSMFVLFKSVILASVGHHEVDWVAHGFALINALVLAKFILIARTLPLGCRAEGAPLICSTLWKSAIMIIKLAPARL